MQSIRQRRSGHLTTYPRIAWKQHKQTVRHWEGITWETKTLCRHVINTPTPRPHKQPSENGRDPDHPPAAHRNPKIISGLLKFAIVMIVTILILMHFKWSRAMLWQLFEKLCVWYSAESWQGFWRLHKYCEVVAVKRFVIEQ